MSGGASGISTIKKKIGDVQNSPIKTMMNGENGFLSDVSTAAREEEERTNY